MQMRDDEEDEVTDIESLFIERKISDEVFHFKSISVENFNELNVLTLKNPPISVKFQYAFCNINIEAYLVLDFSICDDRGNIEPEYYQILVCIGMCKLLWLDSC